MEQFLWIEVAIIGIGPGVDMQVYNHVVAIYHSMTENYDMVFTKCMGKILTCIRLMGYGILYLNSEKEVISACWLIMAT